MGVEGFVINIDFRLRRFVSEFTISIVCLLISHSYSPWRLQLLLLLVQSMISGCHHRMYDPFTFALRV